MDERQFRADRNEFNKSVKLLSNKLSTQSNDVIDLNSEIEAIHTSYKTFTARGEEYRATLGDGDEDEADGMRARYEDDMRAQQDEYARFTNIVTARDERVRVAAASTSSAPAAPVRDLKALADLIEARGAKMDKAMQDQAARMEVIFKNNSDELESLPTVLRRGLIPYRRKSRIFRPMLIPKSKLLKWIYLKLRKSTSSPKSKRFYPQLHRQSTLIWVKVVI